MVTVNDNDDFEVCWICGDPDDHDLIDHGEATGDGLTRYDIVDYMIAGGYEWRDVLRDSPYRSDHL